MDEAFDIKTLSEANPGYEKFISDLYSAISCCNLPFIYINDPVAARLTVGVVTCVLQSFVQPQRLRYAQINAVACFTPRLLYDSILNSLANWHVSWDNDCENWTPQGHDQRWSESMDTFLHGLQAIAKLPNETVRKAKGKMRATNPKEARMVIVFERAEKMKETLPDHIVPLTRLAELSRVNITTIFISNVQWEDIRPSLGASPDPYFIDIPPPSADSTIARLRQMFAATSKTAPTASNAYHPVLQPLYGHFISVLYSVCSPFVQEPYELAYIAAALWPGFVNPVLDEHLRRVEEAGIDMDLELPSEDTRLRLLQRFTPTFTAALGALYPRLQDAKAWADANAVAEEGPVVPAAEDDGDVEGLPRMARIILVAAFLASANPAKSDLRMFGRGLDPKKRARKSRGVTKKAAGDGKPAKIPQRLSGPAPFPLDRLIAILGNLLEDNDVETRPPAPEFVFPGEYTEMEIGRAQTFALIVELSKAGFLQRTSQVEKLEGPSNFKCGISYSMALALARGLDIPLNDLIWDPS